MRLQAPIMSLALATVNPRVGRAQYAVRGELMLRADQIKEELKMNPEKYSFTHIVHCNIGNPHAFGQLPLTFIRQVLACLQYPPLMDAPEVKTLFPEDALRRARDYLQHTPGGLGAYSETGGIRRVREEVAAFVTKRDGHQMDVSNIFLTNGASQGIHNTLNLLIRSSFDGVLVPVPQYPLYSATLTLLNAETCDYYLKEEDGWTLHVTELERAYKLAASKGIDIRGLVVINPGNPTGQCLPLTVMQDIVNFCNKTNIALLADEVYQENLYDETKQFFSFNKVVLDMKSNVPVFSFHSVSKGFLGECGQRGGFLSLTNVPDNVRALMYKLQSITLCGNSGGQITMGMMVNPPQEGDESYPLYQKEKSLILSSMRRRAKRVADALNSCEGISCQPITGAMYAFPSIKLPEKLVDAAKTAGKSPDTFYCLALLEATGMCVVPGSGFGQVDGSYHFRTTILPSEENLSSVMDKIKTFHDNFIKKYM